MAVNLIEWLPDALKDFYEFIKKFEAENPEFDFIYDIWCKWRENLFPRTADNDGLMRFEDLLDIRPLPGDTIEDRRFRVIAKLNSRLPYTEIRLRQILAAILGWDDFELQIVGLELFLWISLKSQSQIRTLVDLLLEIVPENMLFRVINTMQTLTEVCMGAATKEKHWIHILPYQKRHLEDDTVLDISGAQKEKHWVGVLPWQPHALEFQNSGYGVALRNHTVVSVLPPQIKQAQTRGTRRLISYMTVREKIYIPASRRHYDE